MPDEKDKKKVIPLPKLLDAYTDKVVDRIEAGRFKYGCSWAILLTLAYIALFAVVLFLLNKDLSETARMVSHGNWKESISGFFTVMLPVVLMDIAIVVLGLLLFVPVSRIATTFVVNAPTFGFKRTWPVWVAMGVAAAGLVLAITLHSHRKQVIAWQYQTKGSIRSSPAIDDEGNIYFVCDDKYLYALNSSGLRRWRHYLGKKTDASPVIGPDGTIYFGSEDTLYALTSYGKYKWRHFTGGKMASSPVMDKDGTVYYLCNFEFDIVIPWQRASVRLYSFNSEGQLVWEYEALGEVKSPPSIGSDGTIYFITSKGFLYAVTPHGEPDWKYPHKDPLAKESYTSIAIDDDGTLYFGCDNNFLYAVTSKGELKWSYEADDKIRSSPVIGPDGTVYFGSHDHGFYALTQVGDSAVEPRWRFETGGQVLSSPAFGSDGLIYFGSNDHHLYGITPEGKVKFDEIIGGMIQSAPLISQGIIYVGSNNNTFSAVRARSRNLSLVETSWPCSRHDSRNTGRAQ